MKRLANLQADDHILSLAWCGEKLAATPATGEIILLDLEDRSVSRVPGHEPGNGESCWFCDDLATCGFDGRVRIAGREVHHGRGMIERVSASPCGRLLALAQGRSVVCLDREGGRKHEFPNLPATVADMAWNLAEPDQLAFVGAGGARMWKLGDSEPFARFDWGGASLRVEWSRCGRWLATADQTPSVHIYDFTRDFPLHIQGFETKVHALAFSHDCKRLATGGGPVATIWPCTGEKGPEGVLPIQLEGHESDIIAADFSPLDGRLATGDGTGSLLIFTFQGDKALRKRVRMDSGIAAIAWHPTRECLALGLDDGTVTILSLES